MSKHPPSSSDNPTDKALVSQRQGVKSLTSFDTLDTRLKRLTNATLPPIPYILTVPSDRPYNIDPRQAHEWKRGTPFDDNEENLQYLSFLPDWDKGLIVPVGAWDDDQGRAMDRSHSQQSAKSGTSTPNASVKKVKHSLSDYMKLTSSQSGSRSSKEARRDDVPTANGAASSHARKSVSRDDTKQTFKRSREDGEVSESEGSQSAKKSKSSPNARPTARKGPFTHLDLPPDISPTLPPALERELAKISDVSRLDAGSQPKAKPKSSAMSDPSNSDRAPRPKANGEDSSSKSRANGIQKAAVGEKNPKAMVHDSIHVISRPAANGTTSKPREKAAEPSPSKIVRLKIPKSIRMNVARLLKIPQRRPKAALEGQASKSLAESKHQDRLSPLPDSSRKEKRSRADSDFDGRTPPLKRTKHPASLDLNSKPSTPVPAPFRSPTVSQGNSAQKKTATSHPSSDRTLGPSAFASDDHANVSTPQAPARHGTPAAGDPSASVKQQQRPSSLTSRARDELREMEGAYIDIGRQCKRSSDRFLKGPDSAKPQSAAWRRGIVLGVECALAFMMSYTMRDELNLSHAPREEKNLWSTILLWIGRMRDLASSLPHLRGLLSQVEAVCQLRCWMHSYEVTREATSNNAGAADDKGSAASSGVKSMASLMKQYNHALDLFAEGAAELSVDTLQHTFPQTWRAKSNIPLARASVRFDARLDGDFYLPLSPISTPVEAVRAGRALLIEWCQAHDVDWTPSIGRIRPKDGGSKAAS